MDMKELVTALCVVLGLPTLIEISPIKITPWKLDLEKFLPLPQGGPCWNCSRPPWKA